jgi:hypothetical protein
MRDGVIFGLHIRSDTAPFSATGLRQIIRTFTQWGALPFPLQPLTAHSLSRRVRDLLAGDLGAHRHLPVDRDQDAEAATPRQVPVVERRVFEEAEARRGWARRRADLVEVAGVEDLLQDVDSQADEPNRRTAAVLAAQAWR